MQRRGGGRGSATVERAPATGDPEEALADATPYLQTPSHQRFGHVVLAGAWLDVAVTAAASSHPEAPGKLAAMRYFLTYELSEVDSWFDVVARRAALCREVDPGVR